MFDFGIKDIIDIFLVALMLYYIYRLMKERRIGRTSCVFQPVRDTAKSDKGASIKSLEG